MRVLLVEPRYDSRFPPLALLKLGAWHKLCGDHVELVHGIQIPQLPPDLIYITSLFTWSWREVRAAANFYSGMFPHAQIKVGGLYVSLMPEHARQHLPEQAEICQGPLPDHIEPIKPAYSLLNQVPRWKNWNGFLIRFTRGCPNACKFCAVPKIEPEFGLVFRDPQSAFNQLKPDGKGDPCDRYTRLYILDNNLLAAPRIYLIKLLRELMYCGSNFELIDFNQGLPAERIDETIASILGEIYSYARYNRHRVVIRLAFDFLSQEQAVERAIERLKSHGVYSRDIIVYCLYNFIETPDEFLERVKKLICEWRVCAYPMRYQPLDALVKNGFIDRDAGWDEGKLDLIKRFIRVIRYGTQRGSGVLFPYDKLIKKLSQAKDFEQAFSLNSTLELSWVDKQILQDLIQYGDSELWDVVNRVYGSNFIRFSAPVYTKISSLISSSVRFLESKGLIQLRGGKLGITQLGIRALDQQP